MLASNSTCIRVFWGAEVYDMITLTHKVPNDYTLAKSVLIHVGYKDCKSQVNENMANDKMTCLIETVRAIFPRAKMSLSAVLSGRHNKKIINIDRYNKIMYTVCNENGAQYVDLTPRFESSPGSQIETSTRMKYIPIAQVSNR